jgi:PAS domain-containing protein
MLVTKFPLFDSQGRPAGVGSVDTDITRTREEQKAKKEAEEKYWALVEQTLVGIYILQDERLVYVNPKLADIVGYPPGRHAGHAAGKPAAAQRGQPHPAADQAPPARQHPGDALHHPRHQP